MAYKPHARGRGRAASTETFTAASMIFPRRAGDAAGIAVGDGLMLMDCSAFDERWCWRQSDGALEKAGAARNCQLCIGFPKLKMRPGDLTTFMTPQLMDRIYIHPASFVNLGRKRVPLVDKI